jgi:hypothetical protein
MPAPRTWSAIPPPKPPKQSQTKTAPGLSFLEKEKQGLLKRRELKGWEKVKEKKKKKPKVPTPEATASESGPPPQESGKLLQRNQPHVQPSIKSFTKGMFPACNSTCPTTVLSDHRITVTSSSLVCTIWRFIYQRSLAM